MLKRVFIIHGWDGCPEEGWFPWLKRELEANDFTVYIPQMPNSAEPRIAPWVAEISKAVGKLDSSTYFVGHSLGCQAIARYLEQDRTDAVIGGAVFVAGFFSRLTNIGNNDLEKNVVKEWLETPLDFRKARRHLNKSVAIFSDDDPFVPMDNQREFITEFGSDIIIENGAQHFSGNTGTLELPIVKDLILRM
jgi:hypothetical protein